MAMACFSRADLLSDVENIVERLDHIVERVVLHRREGGVQGVAGDHNDLREGVDRRPPSGNTVHIEEVLVRDDEVDRLLIQHPERIGPVPTHVSRTGSSSNTALRI